MEEQIDFIIDCVKEKMNESMTHLQAELSKIRAGRASVSVLDGILVDYYGTPTPINNMASMSTPDARTILIQPWEKPVLSDIVNAINASNLGFNAQDTGDKIIINMPVLTEERRRDLVKQVKVEIENLGEIINSEYTDYVSTISADESVLMFTSRRKGTTGGEFKPQIQEYTEDIYIAENKNGIWSKPKNIGKPVNTERHDAIAGLSFDGQRLFIYRDDENGNGDIYESTLSGEKWSEAIKFPNPINTEFHESTACLAYDGKTLYFVSNREEPGVFGGRDIYMSKWDMSNWNIE